MTAQIFKKGGHILLRCRQQKPECFGVGRDSLLPKLVHDERGSAACVAAAEPVEGADN
jgi:hypothetical protein